jgi:membrane protease YdiL (CAAX protease family)
MKCFLPLLIATTISLHAQDAEEIAALTFPSSPALERIELPPLPALPSYKSPAIATALSIVPGLGHLYLGETKEAFTLAGSFGAGVGILALSDYSLAGRTAGVMACETAWCYGIYAAYRDARLHNTGVDYSYKMPIDTFGDLSQAPFRFSILKKPEVWGGFLGAVAVAAGIGYLHKAHSGSASHRVTDMALPIQAFSVGVSEETLFRGYLQSQLAEVTTPWSGILMSSLAFGAAHISNAKYMSHDDRKNYYKFSLPFITAFGVYCGWMTYKNQSLQEAVALHSWYDFLLFSLAAFADQAATTGKPGFEWAGGF